MVSGKYFCLSAKLTHSADIKSLNADYESQNKITQFSFFTLCIHTFEMTERLDYTDLKLIFKSSCIYIHVQKSIQ